MEDLVRGGPPVLPGTAAEDPRSAERPEHRLERAGSRGVAARSSTPCAIFVPDGVTRWLNRRATSRARSASSRQRALEMLLDDPLGAAELGERRARRTSRASLALDLPEPLHHELEIRRLDARRALALRDEPAARQPPLDPAGRDLVEHGLDELVARPSTCGPAELVVPRSGPTIAARAAARVEVVEPQDVPEQPGSAP